MLVVEVEVHLELIEVHVMQRSVRNYGGRTTRPPAQETTLSAGVPMEVTALLKIKKRPSLLRFVSQLRNGAVTLDADLRRFHQGTTLPVEKA